MLKAARLRMPTPLTADFRSARADKPFAEQYLKRILWPGIDDPDDRVGLYNTDYSALATASAYVALGHVDDQVVAGLTITANADADSAWLNGVRVTKPFRGLGYGSSIVRAAYRFVAEHLKVRRIVLTVRCDHTGKPSDAAYWTCLACGYRPIHAYRVTVGGLAADRHLGAPGSQIVALRMEKTVA